MRKVILVFGLIMGAILSVNIAIMVHVLYNNPDFKSNDFLGYAALVLIFSMVFFGIRNYRNKQLGGYISFGRAFKTGALITLVASTLYVLVWLFYYYLVVPDFMDKYTAHVLSSCTKEDLAEKTVQMNSYKEMYKNPVFVILITYSEVLPIGLLVTLISSLILKRKSDRA